MKIVKKIFKKHLVSIIKLLARFISLLFPIKKGLVLCWSFEGNQYGGSPMCISEYIQNHYTFNYFTVIWLRSKESKAVFPSEIKIVRYGSLKHIYLLNVSEFLITDSRSFIHNVWNKRNGQKYIMTWHGGVGMKKIEGDAIDSLPETYIRLGKLDSKYADLFLSGSNFLTNQYRRAFWYEGEILQNGMPAYDIFFDKEKVIQHKKNIRNKLKLPDDSVVILYAPTFRKDHSIEPYRVDWSKIINTVRNKTSQDVYVLIKLHPGLLSESIDIKSLITNEHVIDVTSFGNVLPLMCASDILISDYSSTMFEMALLKKPSFIYAVDYQEYDRGFYFPLHSLPFPFADNQSQLLANIESFNDEMYIQKVNEFYNNVLGVCDNGNACKSVCDWMLKKSMN